VLLPQLLPWLLFCLLCCLPAWWLPLPTLFVRCCTATRQQKRRCSDLAAVCTQACSQRLTTW
jgi:hypothetical protein